MPPCTSSRPTPSIRSTRDPSDAVALAVRLKVPMYVSENVMETAGFPAWVNVKQLQDEVEIEEFHDFVEHLSPGDFVLDDGGKKEA